MICIWLRKRGVWFKRIFHFQVVKVKVGVSREVEGHMEDPLWRASSFLPQAALRKPWLCPLVAHVTTEHEGCWLLLVSLPDFLYRVCLLPQHGPVIFPLSIFSPGTLDHPEVQSWTEFSGAVWCTPGLAFRSMRFWRWFWRMGCSASWGLTSLSGALAGQHFVCCPGPSHLPPPPLPLTIPSVARCLPSLTVACVVLPSLHPVVSVSLGQESARASFVLSCACCNSQVSCCSTKDGKGVNTSANGLPVSH